MATFGQVQLDDSSLAHPPLNCRRSDVPGHSPLRTGREVGAYFLFGLRYQALLIGGGFLAPSLCQVPYVEVRQE